MFGCCVQAAGFLIAFASLDTLFCDNCSQELGPLLFIPQVRPAHFLHQTGHSEGGCEQPQLSMEADSINYPPNFRNCGLHIGQRAIQIVLAAS